MLFVKVIIVIIYYTSVSKFVPIIEEETLYQHLWSNNHYLATICLVPVAASAHVKYIFDLWNSYIWVNISNLL